MKIGNWVRVSDQGKDYYAHISHIGRNNDFFADVYIWVDDLSEKFYPHGYFVNPTKIKVLKNRPPKLLRCIKNYNEQYGIR